MCVMRVNEQNVQEVLRKLKQTQHKNKPERKYLVALTITVYKK